MKSKPSILLRRSILSLLMAGSACSSMTGFAQTYSYDPTQSGLDLWETSAKWGLISPEFPDGLGVIAQINKTATARTLGLNGKNVTVGELRFNEVGTGSAVWTLNNGAVTLSKGGGQSGVIYNAAGSVTLAANIQASSGVDFSGAGSVVLSNTATRLSGTVRNSGAGNVNIYYGAMVGGAALELSAGGNFILGLNNNAATNTFSNDFVLTGTTSNWRGIWSNLSGAGEKVLLLSGNITGGAGLMLANNTGQGLTELRGSNSYLGGTRIRTDVLFHSIDNFGMGSIIFFDGARTLSYAAGNTADLTVNSSNQVRALELAVGGTIDTGANAVTYQNAVTGAGVLTKKGLGSLKLNGNNSFGGVVISEGDLIAGHANALGGVSRNASIGAEGQLVIEEGVSALINHLTLTSGAGLAFQLGDNTAALLVAGNQLGDGIFTITIDATAPLEGEYTLLSIAGAADAGSGSFMLDEGSSGYGYLNWNQESGVLTFHAIPEPSVGALAILSLLGFGSYRLLERRRMSV